MRSAFAVSVAMEAVSDYVIPVWHPLVVHLPLAALLLAAISAVIWLARPRSHWLQTTTYLALAGAVGAAAGYLTGDAMYQQSEGVPIVEALVGAHKTAGLITLIVSIVSAAVWLAATMPRKEPADGAIPRLWRLGMVALAVAAAAFAVRAGHLGGLMTWGAPPP